MANEIRKPKVGDVVGAIGHVGPFSVIKVDDHARTVDLQLIKNGSVLNNAPWMALTYARTQPSEPKNS
jgi:hypothetical protein